MAISTTQADTVLELYSAYFNRAADADGFAFWQNSFQFYFGSAPSTATDDASKEVYALKKIVIDMATSPEYQGLYPTTLSTTDFVNAIYTNLLNRESDTDGLNFWSGHIDAGTMTSEQAIIAMIAGAKANQTAQGNLDAALISNKNAVSKYFAETLKSNDSDLAKEAFSTVTTDETTIITAQNALDNAINAGETIALTSSIDVGGSFTGTSANETYIGTSEAGTPTINLGDTIDGAAGTDTLKIINSLTGAIPSIETKDIEDYVITNSGNGGSFAISSQSTAPTSVTFLAGKSASSFTLSGIKTATAIALESEASQITLIFDDVTGTSNAFSLSLNDVASTAAVSAAGIETINISTTGATSTLASLTGANISRLTISGNQALTITTALANTITTIDASTATANVSLSVATGVDVTLTGGAGNDYFNIAGLDSNDTINGKTGTDVLSIAADITNASDVSQVTNIETLKFTAATTQDLSLLSTTGIKTFVFAEATADAIYTKNDSSFFHVMSEKTAGNFSATIASNTSVDTLNIELSNSDLSILTATGYETINLKSSIGDGSGNVTNTITTLTNSPSSTLIITGDTNLIITDAVAQSSTINASAFTGELTVTGSALADTITGGTNDDVLTGGEGVDTFTGNTGNDKFITVTVLANDLDTTAGAITDVIKDFTKGTNTISGLGTKATTTNYFEETTAATNLADLLATAETKLDGTFKYYLDSFGGDTYLIVDDNGTGYTDVIKLMGTTLDNIDTSSIVA